MALFNLKSALDEALEKMGGNKTRTPAPVQKKQNNPFFQNISNSVRTVTKPPVQQKKKPDFSNPFLFKTTPQKPREQEKTFLERLKLGVPDAPARNNNAILQNPIVKNFIDRVSPDKTTVDTFKRNGIKAVPTILQSQAQKKVNEFTQSPLTKFGARTAVGLADVATEGLDFASDFIAKRPDALVQNPVLKAAVNKYSGNITSLYNDQKKKGNIPAQKLKDVVDKVQETAYIKPSEDWVKSSLEEKLSSRMSETLSVIGPSVISSIVPYVVNPILGASLSLSSTANQVKDEAISYGVDETKAEMYGLGVGALVSALDRIVPSQVFGASKGAFINGWVNRLSRLALTSAKETGTEIAQEDIQIAAEATFRDDLGWDEIKTRNAMAGLSGMMGGSGMGIVETYANQTLKDQILGGKKPEEQEEEIASQPVVDDSVGQERLTDIAPAPIVDKTAVRKVPASKIVSRTTEGSYDPMSYEYSLNQLKAGNKLEPITVREENGKFIIEDGEHRYKAMVDSGLKGEVEVKVIQPNVPQQQMSVVPEEVPGFGEVPAEEQALTDTEGQIVEQEGVATTPVNNIAIEGQQVDGRVGGALAEEEIQALSTDSEGAPVAPESQISEADQAMEESIQLQQEEEAYAQSVREKFTAEQIKDINSLKKVATSKAFQAGDIETIRNGKNGPLLERVLAAVREANPQITEDVEALKFALSIPARRGTTKIQREIMGSIDPKSGEITTSEDVLLRKQIRDEARGAKEGYLAGSRETRERIMFQIKEQRAMVSEVKAEIVKYAKERLGLRERGKLLSAVKNAKNYDDLSTVFMRIDTMAEKADSTAYRAAIDKELKKPRATKSNGNLKGKGADLHKFIEMVKLNRDKSRPQLEAEIFEKIERSTTLLQQSEEETKTGYDALVREINLESETLPFAGMSAMNSKELAGVLQLLKDIKSRERTRMQEKLDARSERLEYLSEGSVEVATGGKGVKPGDESFGREEQKGLLSAINNLDNWQQGWESILRKVSRFDKTSEGYDSFINREVGAQVFEARDQQNAGMRVMSEKINNKYAEIMGAEGGELRRIAKDMNRVQSLGEFENTDGVVGELKLSQNQAYKKWMEMQDPSLQKTFEEGMKWTPEMMEAVENFLDPRVKEWAQWQLNEFYPEYYQRINSVYRDVYGIDLPYNEFYSPVIRTVDQALSAETLLAQQAQDRASVASGSLKSRVNSKAPLEFVNGDAVLLGHIGEMEHFISFAKPMQEIRSVFSNKDLRSAISQYHGRDTLKILDRLINDIARDGTDKALTVRFLDKARSNFTTSVLAVNPLLAVKQATSIPAFMTEAPVLAVIRGWGNFWKNPRQNYETIMSSEMMKARYDQGMDRDLKLAMELDEAGKLTGNRNVINKLMGNIKMGDMFASIVGGWGVYEHNYNKALKNGASPEDAHQAAILKFERAVNRTQQAGNVEDLGQAQRMGSIWKLFTMFQTAPNAYYRITSNAVRELRSGRGSKAEHSKNLFLTWVLLPSLFQFISDGFEWDEKRQARAVLTGPLNGILIAGDFIDAAGRQITGDDSFDVGGVSPVIGTIESGMDLLAEIMKGKDGIENVDLERVLDKFAQTAGGVTGVPIKPVISPLKAVYDLATGETNDVRRLLYSEYALGGDDAQYDDPSIADRLFSIGEKDRKVSGVDLGDDDAVAVKKYTEAIDTIAGYEDARTEIMGKDYKSEKDRRKALRELDDKYDSALDVQESFKTERLAGVENIFDHILDEKDYELSEEDKKLSDKSQEQMLRTKEFKRGYDAMKAAEKYGLSPEELEKELQKHDLTMESVVYDNKTSLEDDLQLNEIEADIEGLEGQELLATLMTMREISEGTRKMLLTDTIINKMVKSGRITSSQGKYLKTVTWDGEKKELTTSSESGSGKKLNFDYSDVIKVGGSSQESKLNLRGPYGDGDSALFKPVLAPTGTVTKLRKAMPKIKLPEPQRIKTTNRTALRKPVMSISGLGGAS